MTDSFVISSNRIQRAVPIVPPLSLYLNNALLTRLPVCRFLEETC